MADAKGNIEPSTVGQRKRRRHEWWKKKRRQTEQNDENIEQSKKKRVKLKQLENNTEESQEKNADDAGSSRFILFIGGMTDVRILTNKSTGKSKGCAFLEFKNKKIQAKALKLHHSTLCGRRINVEVTCGGGGKGEQRMTKLRSKVDKMKDKRKKAKLKKKQMRQATTSTSEA